jgi:hypothetical protein
MGHLEVPEWNLKIEGFMVTICDLEITTCDFKVHPQEI